MKHDKSKLKKDIYARTPRGFKENIKHMEQEGYSKKRAIGTAYGEADADLPENRDYHKLMKKFKNQ